MGIKNHFWVGAVAAILASAAPAAANIVVNPGFESGSLAPWVSNTSSSDPWTIGPTATQVHSGNFDASTGCVGPQCTDQTNLATAGYLYQDLTTVSGNIYNLTFWFGGAGT
jgi:hypothetical protein